MVKHPGVTDIFTGERTLIVKGFVFFYLDSTLY